MRDRKLSGVKINDDFHKLSADKGIFEIGPKTAEIDRGGSRSPPQPWQGLPDVNLIRVKLYLLLFDLLSWNENTLVQSLK